MGTKTEPGLFDCHAVAMEDEPTFTLLARDITAASLVDAWADRRQLDIAQLKRPLSDMEKVHEARKCAEDMRTWRRENEGKWRSHK